MKYAILSKIFTGLYQYYSMQMLFYLVIKSLLNYVLIKKLLPQIQFVQVAGY